MSLTVDALKDIFLSEFLSAKDEIEEELEAILEKSDSKESIGAIKKILENLADVFSQPEEYSFESVEEKTDSDETIKDDLSAKSLSKYKFKKEQKVTFVGVTYGPSGWLKELFNCKHRRCGELEIRSGDQAVVKNFATSTYGKVIYLIESNGILFFVNDYDLRELSY